MARRSGFVSSLIKIQREVERQQRAQIRAHAAASRAAAQQQKAYHRALEAEERARDRAQAAQEKAGKQAAAEQSKAQKEAARQALLEQKEAEKEKARLYLDMREGEAASRNEELEERIRELENILSATLFVDDYFDLDTLKAPFPEVPPFSANLPSFNPGALANPEPQPDPKSYAPPPFAANQGTVEPSPAWQRYEPAPLTAAQQLLPWARKAYDERMREARSEYERDVAVYKQQQEEIYREAKAEYAARMADAKQRFVHDIATWRQREAARVQALDNYKQQYNIKIAQMKQSARDAYEAQVRSARSEVEAQHAEVEEFKQAFAQGEPDAVVKYFELVLSSSSYPEDFPRHLKVAFVPESKQLVAECDLPDLSAIPEVASYKYVKTKDELVATPRPAAQRRALYASVVAQAAIRTVHELFEADRTGQLDTVVYNGYVETIDPGTGRPRRTCLVTLRTSPDVFQSIDLRHVEPTACLQVLNADVSRNPAELAPVKPVVEFNMVDSRFVEESDILSEMDDRTNLMELTPGQFESLISNLFGKMGLETRLTQASRDGGVDCVAFNPDPILGGKFVIQAKRYKNTVGVSAVRDLYGTMQNEGASKGILVTTSGYGKAAFEFATNKPMQLISGSELLYLLEQHTGVKAKIIAPDDWKDPMSDLGE